MLKSQLSQLRLLAILEGVSYLLLGLTMYLKYVHEMPKPNYIVGMAHGVLFILYCIYVVLVGRKYNWSFPLTLVGLAASLLPFATFIFDAKILSKQVRS